MFRKFAKADVLDFRWSDKRVSSQAGFDKLAEFGFQDYLTDDGYIYVRVRAISSRTNKNHDSWPSDELAKSYRTFIGKPIFIDHHNHDPRRARGVVVDAELHVEDAHTSALDPYYSSGDVDPLHMPPTWVELLLEVDAKKFPKLAKAIISGEIDSVSMGADVGYTTCNICDHKATAPDQFCKHVLTKGASYDYYKPDGTKTSRVAAEHCFKVAFFELSFVFDPADDTALTTAPIKTANRTLRQSIREASMFDDDADLDWGESPEEKRMRERASWVGHGLDDPVTEPAVMPGDQGASLQIDPGAHDDQTYGWRVERFIQMGYTPEQAAEYARLPSGQADLHEYENALGGGATLEQAHEIFSKRRVADDSSIPQTEMTKMPEQINTLRQEKPCQVCGSDMEDGECKLCGYIEPPEGFNNPDLQKAKEVDKDLHQELEQNPEAQQMDAGNQVSPDDVGGATQTMAPAMSATKYVLVSTTVIGEKTAAKQPATRLNTQERPILPATRKNSDKPTNVKRLKNPTSPTLSTTKTQEEIMTEQIKTADGATAQGEGVQAEKRVDVEGVGGVSGDPLSGIKTEDVEKDTGDFEAPHTDTWTGDEGDSLGQHEPVSSEPFESGPIGTLAGVEKIACDCEEDDCPACNKKSKKDKKEAAEHGVTPDSPSAAGFPDSDPSRVDLEGGLAEEVGDRTMTFGDDEFHTTSPVTKDNNANELGGPVGEPADSASATVSAYRFATKAMKLAETEAELGLTKNKWERVAELESKSEEYVDAQLETLSKVRTAGLARKTARARTAGRMPSLAPNAGFQVEAHAVSDEETKDSLTW